MKQATAGNTGLHPLRMLHIGPALGEGGVGAKLAQLDISIEQEPDVYRGLALLSREYSAYLHIGNLHDAGHIEPVSPRGLKPSARYAMSDPVQTSFVGAVVCVDELVIGEYEFFTIAKCFTDLHGVYVYSCCGDEGSVRRAITHGATGLLTDEVLASLRLTIDESLRCLTAVESATGSTIVGDEDDELLPHEVELKKTTSSIATVVKPEVTQPTTGDEVDVDAIGFQHDDDSDAATDPQRCDTVVETDEVLVEDEPIEGEDDLIGPVQVPWERRASTPMRAGPPQRYTTPSAPILQTPSPEEAEADRSGDTSHDEEPSSVVRPKHQPLLTPEELRALIGEPENVAPLEDRPHGDDEGAKLGT